MPKNLRKLAKQEEDTDSDVMRTPDKKRPKKEVSFQDSDVEDEEHLEVEAEATGINPVEMLRHVEGFLEYVSSSGKSDALYRSSLAKLADDYFASTAEDRPFDMETFVRTFRKYFAASYKRITLESSLKCVKDYLETPDCIVHYNEFPRPPPNLLNFYSKKNNIVYGFGKTAELRAIFSADEAGKLECEQELIQLEHKYLKDLEEFKENHASDFSNKQKVYLDKKITSMKKKLLGPIVRNTPKTPKAVSRSKKSPFDLFMATKKDKYTDLDDESRLKKLQKKFEKLDDDKKEIFEKLALM